MEPPQEEPGALWDARFCASTSAGRAQASPQKKPVEQSRAGDAHWIPLEQLLADADAEQDSRTETDSGGAFVASHEGLTQGQLAQVVGLKAKPDLNGAVGTLLRYETQAG